MRNFILISIAAAVILCLSCKKGEDRFSPEEKSAVNAAISWLKLLDDKNFSQSWQNASPFFKTQMTERQWIIGLEYMRAPYGDAISHEIVSCRLHHDYESKTGYYMKASIKCRTTFENQKKVTEFIDLELVDDSWRVEIYYLDR